MTHAVQLTQVSADAESVYLETANYTRVMICAHGLDSGELILVNVALPVISNVAATNVNGASGIIPGDSSMTFWGGTTYIVQKPASAVASALFFIPITDS